MRLHLEERRVSERVTTTHPRQEGARRMTTHLLHVDPRLKAAVGSMNLATRMTPHLRDDALSKRQPMRLCHVVQCPTRTSRAMALVIAAMIVMMRYPREDTRVMSKTIPRHVDRRDLQRSNRPLSARLWHPVRDRRTNHRQGERENRSLGVRNVLQLTDNAEQTLWGAMSLQRSCIPPVRTLQDLQGELNAVVLVALVRELIVKDQDEVEADHRAIQGLVATDASRIAHRLDREALTVVVVVVSAPARTIDMANHRGIAVLEANQRRPTANPNVGP